MKANFLSGIPQQRLLLYCLILGSVPIAWMLFAFLGASSSISTTSAAIEYATFATRTRNQKELNNTIVRSIYQNKELFYIHKELEHFIPLQQEAQKLASYSKSQCNFEEEAIKRRMRYLTEENAVSFVESNEKKWGGIREVELTLSRPVEVDLADIKTLLTKLEGVQIGDTPLALTRPHVIIKEFRLEKKEGFFSETYLLHLKLIQRDYPKL